MSDPDDDAWLSEVERDIRGGDPERNMGTHELPDDDAGDVGEVADIDGVDDEFDLAELDVVDVVDEPASSPSVRSSEDDAEPVRESERERPVSSPVEPPPPVRKILIDDDSVAGALPIVPLGSTVDPDNAVPGTAGKLSRSQRRADKRVAKLAERTDTKAAKLKPPKRGKDDTAAFAPPGPVPSKSSGGEGTMRKVLIAEDDDPLDLSTLPPATTVDPRVRKRRIDVKRAAGRRRFRWFVVVGVAALVIVAALVVLASPIFAVKRINVIGAAYTSPEQLAPLLDEINGEPILTIDPKKLEDKLEALPWVRRAEVDIEFPRTVTVRIAERDPAASYRGIDGRWRIIDRTARVIAIEIGQPADFLPVAGAGPDLEPGETAGQTIATLAELAEVIGDLPQLDASVIGLSAEGTDLTMTMMSPGGTGVQVVFGTSSQLRTKLSALLSLLERDDFNLDDYVQINLTDPSKPALG